jgi:hypothetical protein
MPPVSKCVVLVPFTHSIDQGCERALEDLEKRGYVVRRVVGFSAIDFGRTVLASNALRDGFDELMWIDSDVRFSADDVERLRSHPLPIVCGIYAKKSRRQFACQFLPEMDKIVFGREGGLFELLYAGFGFVLTRRVLFETIQQKLNLPDVNQRWGPPIVPYFQPMVIPDPLLPDGKGLWYLSEDYSFCERARQCGFKIMADTTFRLWHVGEYGFSWEDAGRDKERFATYTYHLSPGKSPESESAPAPPPDEPTKTVPTT